ncbi:Heat-inducible transcription repressor HrcA [Meiothermus luteus]|jgi:heat-inducible transcriptional repressor|uniref:Heat-inducible transcription repressor HrcA n=1 Tax=Meiothermus luteus TaxID=2026184 RepID=A0A399EJU9_9DEIN|nr:HrcA family transcriptional regulator [Meiothermus luteus]RIH83590.1 Heat-inducible transcription repressor HrcA [Meiothermus luteus]RMH56405.1 MAG: HrcA family transcriptional regulator [Deinococcota bacterium]
MTERQRRILHLLVDRYIETRAPVASGTLAERLSLSPATVRYELIELEQQGFISKPHASSGRIPTRAGFRHYALSKLPPQPLPQTTLDKLAQVLEGAGARREALLVQVASKLSGYPAMLRLKPRQAPRLLQVHLSNLTPGQVLAVAVLEGGKVREARLELSFTPTEAQLAEAERRLFRSAQPLKASTPAMLELYESVARAFAQGSPEEYREGMALLLSEPEAQNPAFLRQAITVFEAPSDTTFTPPGGMNIRVGEEEGISLVQAGIGLSDRVGELSLLGPLRMHYEKALSVAYALGQVYMGK